MDEKEDAMKRLGTVKKAPAGAGAGTDLRDLARQETESVSGNPLHQADQAERARDDRAFIRKAERARSPRESHKGTDDGRRKGASERSMKAPKTTSRATAKRQAAQARPEGGNTRSAKATGSRSTAAKSRAGATRGKTARGNASRGK